MSFFVRARMSMFLFMNLDGIGSLRHVVGFQAVAHIPILWLEFGIAILITDFVYVINEKVAI